MTITNLAYKAIEVGPYELQVGAMKVLKVGACCCCEEKKIKIIIQRTTVGLQPQLLNQTGPQSLTHLLGMAFP